jgi:hypothetical protein
VSVKDMLDSLWVSNEDASIVKQASVTNDATVLFNPPPMWHTSLLFDNLEKVAEEVQVVFVVFGLYGWTGDVTEWGEIVWVEVYFVDDERGQECE